MVLKIEPDFLVGVQFYHSYIHVKTQNVFGHLCAMHVSHVLHGILVLNI
jgi:hypothetical protein